MPDRGVVAGVGPPRNEAPARFATAEGTARYAARFSKTAHPHHFREASGLRLSSIGLGTYLGEETSEQDALYAEAVKTAVRRGANVLDTAINYRCQRSERAIGRALAELFAAGETARDEIVIATKGGYLPFAGEPPASREAMADYVRRTYLEPGLVRAGELVGGIHSIAPRYLRDQIGRSLSNLGLETVDIYYVHNPEQQLPGITPQEFRRRLRAAFDALETEVEGGRIRFYGTATWNGYRAAPEDPGYLSLADVVGVAREVAGDDHHFRVVQLPYNLAMHEALTLANQRLRVGGDEGWVPMLEAAPRFGVTVMGSASVLQGRLTRGLPADLERAFPGLGSDARRAIQFSRSTPGITTSLVGMKRIRHVEENLALAAAPPASEEDLLKLFQQAGGEGEKA